ncbi:unnamed protein product, partial [Cyprideis torosa]
MNPFDLFMDWYHKAEEQADEDFEPNAMTLSTANLEGEVSARVVLLKYVSIEGFDFYSKSNSQKGQEMKQNPLVSLSFFWPKLQQQVLVKGRVKELDARTNGEYFKQRPYESRLAALASDQSMPLESKAILIDQWEKLKATYPEEVPVPKHWQGYRVAPKSYEFWQG